MSLLGPQLDAFMAIVKHNTVHRAADTLYVTQTAVTQRIRSLEARLKTTLFIRTRKGMLLTEEGEALLRYCQNARALEHEALSQIHGAGSTSPIHLSITGPSSLMRSRIIPECVPVLKQYPHLFVEFDIDDIEKREQKLKQGTSQLAIVLQQSLRPEMQHKKLEPEEYILVCTSAWKKRTLDDILTHEHIVDFDPSDQGTFNYLKHYDLNQDIKNQRYYANRIEALAFMVANGIGYSVLTKDFAKPWLENGKLMTLNNDQTYRNQYYLSYYERKEMPPYLRELINVIQ